MHLTSLKKTRKDVSLHDPIQEKEVVDFYGLGFQPGGGGDSNGRIEN